MSILNLLLPHGSRVLDLECGTAVHMRTLGPSFVKYGTESDSELAALAPSNGVRVVATDLSSLGQLSNELEGFDAITAIGVFERAHDYLAAFRQAVELLSPTGLLLFETAILSSSRRDDAWMDSLNGHRFLPDELALKSIVRQSGVSNFVGKELLLRDRASTIVGLVTRNSDRLREVRARFERVVTAMPGTIGERITATQLHLLHAGHSNELLIPELGLLPRECWGNEQLARVAQLWVDDLADGRIVLSRLRKAEAAATELEQSIVAATDEVERANRRVNELVRENEAIRSGEVLATQRLQSIESSTIWRATAPLRRVGQWSPALARRARQAAKLVVWTLRGTLVERIRERLRSAERRSSPDASIELPASPVIKTVRLLDDRGVLEGEADPPNDVPWPVDRPRVSVVIPCFNYGHLVQDAIESVQSQTWTDLEIIVVEGGSSSIESRARLAEVVGRSASPRLKVIWQSRPHRAGANRNTGIAQARGQYICCLDADDRLAPTYLEKAVFMLDRGYDVVSPALRFFGKRHDAWTPHERPTLDMLLEGNQVLTCAVYKKSFWRASGGYRDSDPATGHLHEDWLYWVRLAALGARFVNLREPLFYYRSHEGTLSNRDDVLDLASQRAEIRRLNADVLTRDALIYARSCVGPARRPAVVWRRSPLAKAVHGAEPTLLLAVPFLILGGAERLLASIVANLASKGWRILVVSTVPADTVNGDTTFWFEDSTSEIYHLPRFLSIDDWRDFVEMLVETRRVDLLWVVGSAFFYDMLPRLRMRFSTLSVADLLFNIEGHTANNRRYADCIDLTFVESREVREWLVQAGEHPDRIQLVESGVDLEKYAPASDQLALRRELAIPLDDLVVGFCGRWSPEKDPLGFVEIAKRVPSNLPITFVMTGAGPQEAELRNALQSAGLAPERFLLKGAVPDVKRWLQAFDVLTLPSRLDGRPNIVMEALACGVCVVASRVGALPEMLDDGRQGRLLNPGDYDAFAACLSELSVSRDLLEQWRRAARAHAECRLDIRQMLVAYYSGLSALIRKTVEIRSNL